MRITCPRCGYTWDTKSSSRYVKCPRCYANVKNPMWRSTTTTTTSTTTNSTTTSTTTTTTTTNQGRGFGGISVSVLDVPGEAYDELRRVAEEISTPDQSGIEVLVLDPGKVEEILSRYGIRMEE